MRQTASLRLTAAAMVVASAVLGACRASGPPPEGTPTLPPPAVTSVSAPDPELTARMFLEAWQEARYEDMYAMLSPLTTDSLSQEDFIARYEGVRQNGAIDRIDYEIVSSLVSPRSAGALSDQPAQQRCRRSGARDLDRSQARG